MTAADKHPDYVEWPGLHDPNFRPEQKPDQYAAMWDNITRTTETVARRKGWEQDITKGGAKFDADKLRWDLVPPEFEAVVQVLTYGAHKYADRNWEKGSSWCRFFAAAMRHCWAWMRGEDKDPETGLPHMAHAVCCLLFILTYEARGMTEYDDRPKGASR